MSNPKVAVVDYGMGNLFSVQRGFEYLGAKVSVTSDPVLINSADKVVLPGVGAFPDAMQELECRGLALVIKEVAHNAIPLLGICLGMQLLFDRSFEFQETQGLGLISGDIVPLPTTGKDGLPNKVPHIGWSSLYPTNDSDWEDGLLGDIEPGDSAYFVHSYMAQTTHQSARLANCNLNGIPVDAVVSNGLVFGCQFHPEKSGDVGLRILRRFLMA